MKVKLTTSKTTVEEVEITLPIYREHDYGGDNGETIYYVRIAEDLSRVEIKKSRSWSDKRGDWNYEIEFTAKEDFSDKSGADYVLGRGIHKSSAEEFNAVLAELKARVAAL